MKKLFLLLLTALVMSGIFAAPIGLRTAEQAAKAYFTIYGNDANPSVQLVYTHYSDAAVPVFYVYNRATAGFVMIAADNAVQPILAHSLTGAFSATNMPANLTEWLGNYQKQIQYVIEHQLPATPDIANEWKDLLTLQVTRSSGTDSVQPLCTTKWNQWNSSCTLYNDYTPLPGLGGQNSTPTGCTATAMAQIMKYWNWPTTGQGSHTYSTSTIGGTLSADFGNTTYQWENMPDTLTCNSTAEEKDAVALLMYHCGVAVNMNYDTIGSGAKIASYGGYYEYCSENAFKDFFRYHPRVKALYRDYKKGFEYGSLNDYLNDLGYTQDEWKRILKDELNALRPILYCGFSAAGGHTFVCDGYDNNDFFHFNWGWAGQFDGYFTVDNLVPIEDYPFNEEQIIVVGIMPLRTQEPMADFEASKTTVGVGQSVQFTDLSLGIPTSWQWTFEGGVPSSSTAQNPTVYFTSPGTYAVTLIATNALGTDTLIRNSYITVDACGVSDGNIVGQLYCYYWLEDGNYSFPTGTNPYYLAIANYFDAQPGILESAFFTFAFPQQATENLMVNFTVYAATDENTEPGAVLSTSSIPFSQIVEDAANHRNTKVSFNPPVDISSQPYFIAFDIPTGDNGDTIILASGRYVSSPRNTFWYYREDGWTSWSNYYGEAYNLNLAVYPVICRYPIAANFEAAATTVGVGQLVQFSDHSTGTPTGWNWTFEGGNPSSATVQNPVVSYSTPGTYSVSLIASNDLGADTLTQAAYIKVVEVSTEFTETACGSFTWNETTYTASGNHYQAFTDVNGNDSIVVLHLTILELPEVEITIEASTLTATEGMESYLWSTGETTPSINISEVGTYSVTVTNAAGCENSATIVVTGIASATLETIRPTIYPNPNHGSFTLRLNGIPHATRYQIIDSKGSIISEAPIRRTEEQVTIRAARGTYLVRVITDKQVFTETVIVQ